MRSRLSAFLSALLLTAPMGIFAQVKRDNPDHLVARISYANTLMDRFDSRREVCVAVYEGGLYRLWRPNLTGLKPGSPDPLRTVFQGTLTKEQMEMLGSMLKNLDFKSKGGGLLEEGSESFLAELVNGQKTERLQWVNSDHHLPFPQAIDRIIDWMQDIGTQGTQQITLRELSDISVCPSANDNPLPLTASMF